MRFPLLLALGALFLQVLHAEPPRKWERWTRCTQLADKYYDGDSFQVKHGSKPQILRLYGADAPETDAGLGRRIDEQAAYFGVRPDDVLRGGATARAFTARFLSNPFDVITRRKVAPGASRSDRIYAMVERDGADLAGALVQAGLARATTETGDYPDAAGAQRRMGQLRALEQKAKQERRGLWSKAPGPPGLRRLNLNTARAAEIEALPGIGPKTAQAILRARPLKDIGALEAIPGLGVKKIAALRPLVSF